LLKPGRKVIGRDVRSGLHDGVYYELANAVSVLGDFEVPDAHDRPAVSPKLAIDPSVSGYVSSDLLVPVSPGATGAMPGRVAVPEGSIDEHGDLECRPCDVWTAGCTGVVAAPASGSKLVKSTAEGYLWVGVALPYRDHDPAPLLRGPSVRHETRECQI
jgi:hypothetical protein